MSIKLARFVRSRVQRPKLLAQFPPTHLEIAQRFEKHPGLQELRRLRKLRTDFLSHRRQVAGDSGTFSRADRQQWLLQGGLGLIGLSDDIGERNRCRLRWRR